MKTNNIRVGDRLIYNLNCIDAEIPDIRWGYVVEMDDFLIEVTEGGYDKKKWGICRGDILHHLSLHSSAEERRKRLENAIRKLIEDYEEEGRDINLEEEDN